MLTSVSFALLGLTACNDFEGNIQVNEQLQLKAIEGTGTVLPGSYGVKIDFPEKNKARMEIQRRGKNNNSKVYFRIGSRYFPKYNGPINIPAAENGQPYDLVGRMETDTHDGYEQWTTEYCSVTVTERVCEVDYYGNRRCRLVERVVSGESQIRYFDRVTRQYLDLNLEDPRSRRTVAEAAGRNSYSERIVTFRGACRVYGGGGGGGYPGGGYPGGGHDRYPDDDRRDDRRRDDHRDRDDRRDDDRHDRDGRRDDHHDRDDRTDRGDRGDRSDGVDGGLDGGRRGDRDSRDGKRNGRGDRGERDGKRNGRDGRGHLALAGPTLGTIFS